MKDKSPSSPLTMCYFLFLASPLTLSEVRSMLPAGLSADLLPMPEQRTFRHLIPDAQTAARLVRGACSCDLVAQRHAVSRKDEAALRVRYRAQGLSRDGIIRALENHRRALEERARPEGHWPKALAEFVVEHARNAGPTLYLLRFSHEGLLGDLPDSGSIVRLSAADVRGQPGTWLQENKPTLVEPMPRDAR